MAEELTYCCGACEIGGFEYRDDYDGSYKDQTAAMAEELAGKIGTVPNGKLVVLTLIDSQLKDGWKYVVEKAGFKLVQRWINSNHGNVCNLYVMQKGCTPAPKYKGKERYLISRRSVQP